MAENSQMSSKQIRKRVLAHYKQFLFFPQSFQETCAVDTLKRWVVHVILFGDLGAGQMNREVVYYKMFNSLPNKNCLDLCKLKAFVGDQLNLDEKLKFVSGRTENIVGKGKKCWLTAFSAFLTMFPKGFHARVIKSRDCVVKT